MDKIIFTPFPLLTTERLILRQLMLADENEMFVLRSVIAAGFLKAVKVYLGREKLL